MVLGNSYVDVVVATSNRNVSFVDDWNTNAMDVLLFTKLKDVLHTYLRCNAAHTSLDYALLQ